MTKSLLVSIGRGVLAVAACLVLIGAAACSAKSASTTVNSGSITTTKQPEAANPLVEMLKMVPDLPATRQWTTINDYLRFDEAFGSSRLPQDIGSDPASAAYSEFTNYVMSLSRNGMNMQGPFISGLDQYSMTGPIRRENVGFGPQDVFRSMQAGAPPSTFQVLAGQLDPKATDQALSKQGWWSSSDVKSYAVENYRGVNIHSWGDGLKLDMNARLAPPLHDMLGRAQPLAVSDGWAFSFPSVEGLKMLIDLQKDGVAVPSTPTPTRTDVPTTQTGPARVTRLSDNANARALAEQMWQMGAYSFLMTDKAQTIDSGYNNLSKEMLDRVLAEPVMGPYRAFASGIGKDAKGLFMALVLVYDTPSQATLDVDAFRNRLELGTSLARPGQAWKSIAGSIDEISVVDRSLRVKLRGSSPTFWLQFVTSQDPLLMQRSSTPIPATTSPPTTTTVDPVFQTELQNIRTAVMAMLADSGSKVLASTGTIVAGPPSGVVDMHTVTAMSGTTTFYLDKYLRLLGDSPVTSSIKETTAATSGAAYVFSPDGTVAQRLPASTTPPPSTTRTTVVPITTAPPPSTTAAAVPITTPAATTRPAGP